MNITLKRLYDLDRDDHAAPRIAGTQEYDAMRSRDAGRRQKVRILLENGSVSDPVDLYHAAWILNHGDEVVDAELAWQLAQRSLYAGYEPAKWLYAAAFDRAQMYRGLAQKFGTQIVPDGRRYRLWDTDPATSDDERASYNVPPLAEMRQRADKDSSTLDQPPMEHAPAWLLRKVSHWQQKSFNSTGN